jgi:hypothetical protein
MSQRFMMSCIIGINMLTTPDTQTEPNDQINDIEQYSNEFLKPLISTLQNSETFIDLSGRLDSSIKELSILSCHIGLLNSRSELGVNGGLWSGCVLAITTCFLEYNRIIQSILTKII